MLTCDICSSQCIGWIKINNRPQNQQKNVIKKVRQVCYGNLLVYSICSKTIYDNLTVIAELTESKIFECDIELYSRQFYKWVLNSHPARAFGLARMVGSNCSVWSVDPINVEMKSPIILLLVVALPVWLWRPFKPNNISSPGAQLHTVYRWKC